MRGSEGSRSAARYAGNRALFLLLLASPYQTRRLGGENARNSGLMQTGK
jgi:hypothetical protein